MTLDVPDFAANGYSGPGCNTMERFHQMGKFLFLSGKVEQCADAGWSGQAKR